MATTYLIDGKRVKRYWYVVLSEAKRQGVDFTLTSGSRTKTEQLQLIAEKGVWSPSNPTGAARYSPWAPHIRIGRQDHAIDVNALDGGEARLQRWLERQGVRVRNPVPGEPWHMELSYSDLRKLARRFGKWAGYPEDELRWITEYDKLKRAGRGRERRGVLRRYMARRRKDIWRAAKDSGWRRNNRIKRYASLRARTR